MLWLYRWPKETINRFSIVLQRWRRWFCRGPLLTSRSRYLGKGSQTGTEGHEETSTLARWTISSTMRALSHASSCTENAEALLADMLGSEMVFLLKNAAPHYERASNRCKLEYDSAVDVPVRLTIDTPFDTV